MLPELFHFLSVLLYTMSPEPPGSLAFEGGWQSA